jgi:hypothetical protein
LLRWLGTLSIGGMAMRVSWVHLNDLMASRGQKADVAILGPLAIDCLAIMATALILAGRRGQRGGEGGNARWVNPGQVATKLAREELAHGQDSGHGLGQALANTGGVATGHEDFLATQEFISGMLARAAETPGHVFGQPDDGQDLAKAYATVGDEASDYLASLANHPELDTTSTPPAPLPQRTSTERTRAGKYDKAAALAAIRSMLDGGAEGAQIDAAVSEAFGVSTRTARRLRAEVSGRPVSGPPDGEGVS